MMRVRELGFSYGEESVLSGVTFDVESGELLAVMGANGSGKTTLLRLLAGLREPDAGAVEVDGAVGFAPEDPRSALFARTVSEEVAFFPRNRGLDVEPAVERALNQLAVEHLRDRSPLGLSFGEQRRVAIAAVLAGRPAVAALDEPTAGLDQTNQEQLGSLLSGLGDAVALSTHATDFAYRYADRVAVLVDGRLEQVGPARATLTDETLLEEAGIRPPGIVTWAARQGLDPSPTCLEEAVASVRGDR